MLLGETRVGKDRKLPPFGFHAPNCPVAVVSRCRLWNSMAWRVAVEGWPLKMIIKNLVRWDLEGVYLYCFYVILLHR